MNLRRIDLAAEHLRLGDLIIPPKSIDFFIVDGLHGETRAVSARSKLSFSYFVGRTEENLHADGYKAFRICLSAFESESPAPKAEPRLVEIDMTKDPLHKGDLLVHEGQVRQLVTSPFGAPLEQTSAWAKLGWKAYRAVFPEPLKTIAMKLVPANTPELILVDSEPLFDSSGNLKFPRAELAQCLANLYVLRK